MRIKINQVLVKERMRAEGWTQEALVEASGIDHGNLHRILTGQVKKK